MIMLDEAILERNARCPLCKKYYHRLDIHKNPVPSKKNQRTEEELCQCGKGKAAREYRKQVRLEMDEQREQRAQQREELLTLDQKRKEFWKRKKQGGDK